MPNRLIYAYSKVLQGVAQGAVRLTGRGAGRLATLLPKGQTFWVENYCDKFRFQVDTTYPMEGTIWLSGRYDLTSTQWLQKVLRPNDIFFDIGANCGALTLVAAETIATGHIYAFEPAPEIRARLHANLAANPGLPERITIVPYGLGKDTSQLFYQEDPNFRGNGSLFPGQGTPVEILPLDVWIAQQPIPHVDVIKMDVEGMEYEVLQGSQELLKRDRPLIYFETLPQLYGDKPYSIRTIYEFLQALGYRIVSPKAPYAEVSLDGPYPPNSVAVQKEHGDRFT